MKVNISRGGRKVQDTIAAYTLLSPTTILLTVFYFIPLILTLINSFYQFNLISPNRQFVGINNYRTLLQSFNYQAAFMHTVTYALATVLFSTILALFFAVLMNQKIRGRSIYRAIFFIPVIAPTVATSIVFSSIFANDNTGFANQILGSFNIQPIAWLGDPNFAMITVVAFGVWSQIGYNMVIYLAGLQNIPSMYYEAARLEGAGTWSLFRRITLPLLSNTTLFVIVVGVIGAFQVFNQVYVMTQGGPLNATTVMVYYIYEQAFQNFNGGAASTASAVLFLVLLVLSVVQIKFFSNKN